MSKDDTSKRDKTVLITLITVFGSIIVAFITTYRNELAPLFFNSPTATFTATLVISVATEPSSFEIEAPVTEVLVEQAVSPAILTVDQYFKYINSASISDDLRKAWDLLTTNLQCNPSDNCDFAHYRDYWWQLKVQYKLFDCGANTVASELIYYDRAIGFPSPVATPNYVNYELIYENGQLKLNGARIKPGISNSCSLVLSAP